MADPITIGAVGVWALSGLVGNLSDRFACVASRKVLRSFLDGLRDRRNHDLTRAVRRSQLLALRLVVRAYKKLPPETVWHQPISPANDLSKPLMDWISEGLLHKLTLERDLSRLAEEDQGAWNERLRTIESQIEKVFVEPPPHDGSSDARLTAFRQLAEDWMLAEAAEHVHDTRDWERFKALFLTGSTGRTESLPRLVAFVPRVSV